MYYRSTATGKILSESSARILNDIFGEDTVTNMAADGLLVSIENPSVIDCIHSGNMASAITRYREIHDCNVSEAKKAVYSMRSDMSKARNIYKKKLKKVERSVGSETEETAK